MRSVRHLALRGPARFHNSLPRANFSTATASEKHEFKAETRKLLDIVSNSLYSERDIFLRELVSNSSDALEKYRFLSSTNNEVDDRSLQISIEVDKENKKLIIRDNGIGMTKEEMTKNLGTIGKSDSADFVKENSSNSIIGKFGVGFYSAFMVGDEVSVTSKSSKNPSEPAHKWTSNGVDDFTIAPVEEQAPGTSITISLKDDEFLDKERVRQVIERYGSFVTFPIMIGDERVNTINAIWAEAPNKVTPEQYEEFYKFTYSALDKPTFTLHYRADAPIEMKCLLFVPQFNPEAPGMPRARPGVSLYTRKVLLQKESDILPPWGRFIKGVVDSEDLPLSISRETAQDKRMITRMGKSITKRVLKFLNEKATSEPKQYQEFWKEFGHFIGKVL